MRFVDEFRDPELARSLVTQLEKLMEKLPHFGGKGVEDQHIDDKMQPAPMHKHVGEQPVVLLAVHYLEG